LAELVRHSRTSIANEMRDKHRAAGIERVAIAPISTIATLRPSSRRTFIRDLDVPDEIAGDFDPVHSSVRKFYAREFFLYQDQQLELIEGIKVKIVPEVHFIC
jgi:hypothetical protein